MEKICIYDFCQTLANFETADEFVHYVRRQLKSYRMRMIDLVRVILVELRIIPFLEKVISIFAGHFSINKRLLLYELKGLSEETINAYAQKYYTDVIRPNLVGCVVDKLKREKEMGYDVAIVSASYEPFLRFFMYEYDVDYLVTNKFKYDEKGRFIGRMAMPDCYGKQKVIDFYRTLPQYKNNNDKILFSYGDSISDLPILKIAQKGIVVSCKNSKGWPAEHGMEEIIW